MKLSARIEVNGALLISFSHYKAFALVQIDIFPVETHELADTHACRSKQINNGKISFGFTGVSQDLQFLIAKHLLVT